MYDRRKSPPRQILVSLFCLFALGYFAYHAVVGKRGLEARSRLIERSRQLGPQIERLEAIRTRLEQEVRLLDAADPDIVEELAIELLGFVRPGDRVVVLPAEAPEPRWRSRPQAVSRNAGITPAGLARAFPIRFCASIPNYRKGRVLP